VVDTLKARPRSLRAPARVCRRRRARRARRAFHGFEFRQHALNLAKVDSVARGSGSHLRIFDARARDGLLDDCCEIANPVILGVWPRWRLVMDHLGGGSNTARKAREISRCADRPPGEPSLLMWTRPLATAHAIRLFSTRSNLRRGETVAVALRRNVGLNWSSASLATSARPAPWSRRRSDGRRAAVSSTRSSPAAVAAQDEE